MYNIHNNSLIHLYKFFIRTLDIQNIFDSSQLLIHLLHVSYTIYYINTFLYNSYPDTK